MALLAGAGCSAQPTQTEAWARKVGLGGWLDAPVAITQPLPGIVSAEDTGIYLFQYDVQTPAAAAEPNVVIDKNVVIPKTADKIVFVTHGWFDKGQDWPDTMAAAIREKTDPNAWVCGYFGWAGGSKVITSIAAARYARDIGGPRLAAAILSLSDSLTHVHLIGHSAGSWVIDSAARRIAQQRPNVSIHLTFLDAYVPQGWDPNELGAICSQPNTAAPQWAEHYYTRDITYRVTQLDLHNAHNVDITAIDPWVAEHEFPYRWYLATITGKYDRWDEKSHAVAYRAGLDYGFARSREAGDANWQKSLQLTAGNPAVRIEKSEEDKL